MYDRASSCSTILTRKLYVKTATDQQIHMVIYSDDHFLIHVNAECCVCINR
jgi:hypothetical protein